MTPSQDRDFKQFQTMALGYRAMFVLLYTYQKKHGCNCLRQMINRYAPPVENHTENYINFVCRGAGVQPDDFIDTNRVEVMVPVVAAMSQVENGVPAIMQDVRAGWDLFVRSKP